MLNQVVLVGRVVSDPVLEITESKGSVSNITVACPRSYKNADGEYETDFINTVLWNGIAENVTNYVKKGDLIGIKGRLQSFKITKEDGSSENRLELIAEKVTFLSSKKQDDENGEEQDGREENN